ncbi:MAG: O-antigen ligase family protein [Devosia sp.]|uniref:O-antigen ligase family protein n=1 Tax=Devosia sp. 66-22 TaxID=1895753 RepID=UPI0009295689|nr:O-antigen ligase [Devosia sp. 66-22]MBN9345671.1 O-antigen ligase family protein [Devosia sp.]OJX53025.1 MAG: exopolysaccharide biosynthesis protein [Devosia sp. 66-22]
MAQSATQNGSIADLLASGLFLALFAFYWITISPFVDLTGAAAVDPSAGNSNALNQLIALALFGSAVLFYLVRGRTIPLFGPMWLLVFVIGWCVLTSLIAVHPDLAIKRTILVAIVAVNAAVMLILPRSAGEFAKLLAIGVLAVLALCYYGVIFRPTLAIHQASEIREPMNAGLWRGLFPHKNSAAGAMVLIVFIGLFVASVRSKLLGFSIVALATFFLAHTGGKTSTLVLPVILLLAWGIERFPWSRIPVVVGGLVAFNVVAVGSAVFEPLRDLVTALGVDPTFTNRADIWRFAFSAIAERPFTGYGLQSFWQTEGLVYGGDTLETWAAAAYNGHNGYLDALISMGIPGLIITVIWAVFIPIGDLGRAQRAGNDPRMTRLFVRIWLYVIFNGCVESVFYEGGGALWFCLLFALFGLRLQGLAHLVPAEQKVRSASQGGLAHA